MPQIALPGQGDPPSGPGAAATPSLPPGPARMLRVNHDYHRRGAVAYLAAYDVRRAKVSGRCKHSTGIASLQSWLPR